MRASNHFFGTVRKQACVVALWCLVAIGCEQFDWIEVFPKKPAHSGRAGGPACVAGFSAATGGGGNTSGVVGATRNGGMGGVSGIDGTAGLSGGLPLACTSRANAGIMCGRWDRFASEKNEYVVQNNIWNPDATTIHCTAVDSNGFCVSCSEHVRAVDQAPAGYPSVYVGCDGTDCTTNSGLPFAVEALGRLSSTWVWRAPEVGAYNVLYTLTFSRRASTAGTSTPSHLKIWLSRHSPAGGTLQPEGAQLAGATILDGQSWQVWCSNDGLTGRQEAAYVLNDAAASPNRELLPFIRDAEVRRDGDGQVCLDPGLSLVRVEAGFELWSGGVGLCSNAFSLAACPGESCNGQDDDCDGVADNGFDLRYDPSNCGNCGTECAADKVCSNGTCADRCIGSVLCSDGKCHDIFADNANCGQCGNECLPGYVCNGSGVCSLSCLNGLVNCSNRCVDTASDAAACGSCTKACGFTNATAFCSAGTCRLGACVSGFGDADGLESNGCECALTIGGVEICDGLDNDCDGIVDWSHQNGILMPACQCREQVVTVNLAEGQCGSTPSCLVPQCSLANAGQELEVSYSLGACASPYPWAQCRFDSANLNAFDADHGAAGILEIDLCVVGPQAGESFSEIGIYYGSYPGRKRFAYFSSRDLQNGLSTGCYRKHFRPADAACQLETGLAATCLSGCANGQWGTGDRPECVFNFDQVPLWIAAEFCRGTTVTANLQKVQVRYLTGSACVCQSDIDCSDPHRPVCNVTDNVCVPHLQ